MRRFAAIVVALCLAGTSVHAADERKPCESGSLQVPDDLKKLKFALMSAHCGSVKTVLQLLVGQRKVGGRKLEGDKPLDVAAARQERQQAMADPEFREVLARDQQGETDPQRRLLLEAAALHEFGHFKARDLVLGELTALPKE